MTTAPAPVASFPEADFSTVRGSHSWLTAEESKWIKADMETARDLLAGGYDADEVRALMDYPDGIRSVEEALERGFQPGSVLEQVDSDYIAWHVTDTAYDLIDKAKAADQPAAQVLRQEIESGAYDNYEALIESNREEGFVVRDRDALLAAWEDQKREIMKAVAKVEAGETDVPVCILNSYGGPHNPFLN